MENFIYIRYKQFSTRKNFTESRLGYVDLTNRTRVIMQSRDTPSVPSLRGDVFVLLLFFHRRGEALPRDNRFAPKIEALSREAGAAIGSRGSRILNYLPGTEALSSA